MEYVVNERGERTKVILSIEEYERLVEIIEDAEDVRIANEQLEKLRSGESERIPWEEAKRRMREGE